MKYIINDQVVDLHKPTELYTIETIYKSHYGEYKILRVHIKCDGVMWSYQMKSEDEIKDLIERMNYSDKTNFEYKKQTNVELIGDLDHKDYRNDVE